MSVDIKRIVVLVALFGLTVPAAWAQEADKPDWPRGIDVPEGKITIYQPQVESFKGNKLTARAAVSVVRKGKTEPVFGAVWFDCRVDANRDTRTVMLLDVDVPNVKFPKADAADQKQLSDILEREIPKWELVISLDRVVAQLDVAQKEQKGTGALSMTPPKIILTKEAAVLVTIEGEPKLKKAEGSALMRVVNTPFFIALDPATKGYYLKGGSVWYTASAVTGPWKAVKAVPAAVTTLEKTLADKNPPDAEAEAKPAAGPPPKIIIATEPTELISAPGGPEFKTIAGTDLLYVSNATGNIFMQIGTQRIFVLVSGRWFSSLSKDGPWVYLPASALPADFKKIASTSDKAAVLASIPGTEQAKDAVLDASIPQTAAVKRDAKVTVVYDGAPKFQIITGTAMYYASNTSYSVIRIGTKFYCCHNGMWFESDSALGPWKVCVSVPGVVYTIPASSPVYSVKYVRVYSHTPSVVYVGYTPGYTGTYVYGGTVVYGTGYVYRGWYGAVYYPRPVTYGYAVAYSPYVGYRYRYPTGWLVAGAVTRGIVRHHRYHHWRDFHEDRYKRHRNAHNNHHNRSSGGRPGTGRPGTGRPGTGRPGTGSPGGKPGGGKPHRTSNVFADKKGNVHRKTMNGWEKRGKSGWGSSSGRTGTTRSSHKPTTTQNRSLDRQYQARDRGNRNTSSYRSSSSSRSRSSGRSGGGRRGGGRRR